MPDEEVQQTDPPTGTNIVLVGFMATGKSSVGREVARLAGYGFADSDDLVVQEAGCSIPKIFEERGEDAFRDLETKVLRHFAEGAHRKVLSTGGGAVLREENRKVLNELGFVVWLTADKKTLLKRAGKGTDRPLLQTEDPEESIRALLEERDPIYRDVADLAIDSTDLTVSEVAYGVVESARVYFS